MITEYKHLSRDPQLSNIHHLVGYSKDGNFQIKIIHELYYYKEELCVKQYRKLCSFISPFFRFKETRFVNFFTDPELSSSLYVKLKTKKLLQSKLSLFCQYSAAFNTHASTNVFNQRRSHVLTQVTDNLTSQRLV